MGENNLIVQLGSILITLVVTLLGIFKGLIPQLLGSFEKRLADKDTVLEKQSAALDDVCKERKEMTESFVTSLYVQTNIMFSREGGPLGWRNVLLV